MTDDQKEMPAPTINELENTVGKKVEYLSGGMIMNFRAGWAMNIMGSGQVAHYFIRSDFDNAVAICKAKAKVRWIYGQGNYPQCANCFKRL